MSARLVTQFWLGNGMRSLSPSIGFYFSAPVKASSVAIDAVRAEEQTILANAKPFEEIPSVRTFPIIGSSWIYFPLIGKYNITKLHIADVDKYKTYGSIFKEKFRSHARVHIFDPDDVEKMFRHEGQYPSRSGTTAFKAYDEYRKNTYKAFDVTYLQGKDWHDVRSKMQPPLLVPNIIKPYIEPMDRVSRDFVKTMYYLRDENKEIPNFLKQLYKWGLESVFSTVLDTRLGCLDRNLPADSESLKMIESVLAAEECAYKLHLSRGSMELWKIFPTPTWKKFVSSMDFVTEITSKYINQTVNTNDKDEDKKLTLLMAMMQAPGLEKGNALGIVSGILQGGIVATSNVVGFLLYWLARNPTVQEKLYEEIVKFLPNRSDRQNFETLSRTRYLKACIKESMRLSPLVRGNGRTLDHDIVLSGYKIPAGVQIFAAFQAASRIEKYFKEANKFIPERWLNAEEKPHPFLLVPFGFGPRTCMGKRFADLQMKSIVIEIIRNFKVEYHHEDIGIITKITNYPDRPLNFRFIERPF